MREGLKLSSLAFILGILILFQKTTLMRFDFFSMLLLAIGATLLCEVQMKRDVARIIQLATMATLVFYTVSVVVPIPLPSNSLTALSASCYSIDHALLKNMGVYAFLIEVNEYIFNPDKLDFYHWQYLFVLFTLGFSELLYQIHRREWGGIFYLVAVIVGGLLWFTYLDVWVIFACFFIAYATERLTRQGKGALFGLVLPVGITIAALLATSVTPVEKINERLSPLTSENGWLRTALDFSPGGGAFGLREMGFYPLENRLGGPVKLSKEIMFRVKSATPSIYLRGRVLTVYENNQWQHIESEPSIFDVSLGKKTELIAYTIYDLKTKTNSVLVPMTVSQISIPYEKLQYGRDGEVFYTGNLKQTYKDGFNVTGYNSAYTAPVPEADYLQLPKQYSPKVVALTKQIIKGATTEEEKVKRIRKYLLNNYTYALAVTVPPKEQDFVEQFLLQEDSGYCVYFATSTVVMCRIAGIPSRYVEGFVTPKLFESGRDAAVSGERAHAWAEVYYNRKWQIVETTPTYTSLTEYDQKDAQYKSDLLTPEKSKDSSKEETDIEPENLPQEKNQNKQMQLPLGLMGLALGIGLLLALAVFKFKAYFNVSSKVLQEKYVYLLLVGLSEYFGLRTPERLTPREIIRICDGYAPSLNLLALVEIVEKSLYDSSDISDQEIELLAQTYWQLFHAYFKWHRKLIWCMKIAGKGRIFNGNDGKNSTS